MASVVKPASKNVKQAGASLKSGVDNPNPIRHGGMGQAERAFSAASTFLSGIMAISASQFIGAPLKLIDSKFYEAYMAWTKESFAVLMTTITQWWAPTVVRVSGDESMKGQLFQMDDGDLRCNFPHRLIMMGNHQLYTDWLYLWWIAYTNKMHGRIYIILKESLKQVPIIGWGMQFYNFIFLSRKWEQDRYKFKKHLDHLKNPQDPMWLLIFPEGTNLSAVTREKSASWSKKTGIPDMKHQLLPRTTGLQFCLQEMRPSTNWLYDCTIAYEGVPKGLYGQDIFTLKSSLFEGRPPKSVNMFFRRFKISEIPYQDDEQFQSWLVNRWREKDYMLEYFYKFGSFSAEDPAKAMLAAEGKRKPKPAKAINTSVKGGGWDEFLSIFGPITTAAGALSSIDPTEPVNFDELMRKVAQSQQFNLLNIGKAPKGPASQEAIRRALLAANKQNPLPNTVLDRLLKAPPNTQAQMKKVLQSSGDPKIAKKVATAPAADASISAEQQKAVKQASAQAVGAVASAKAPPPAPAETVRKEIPLANMESMITRPITTMAIHSAGSQLKNMAAQRASTKGAALPGQPPPPVKKTSKALAGPPRAGSTTELPSGYVNRTNGAGKAPSVKAASVNGAPRKLERPKTVPPKKAASVQGESPATPNKPPTFVLTEEGKKKLRSPNSKPLGTLKYANGKMS
ncbi:putative acyltransferase [Pseudocercospora fuligena]|uniref:Putative acyltransferase n=1 Tax=Pseudocercospora fuligena TaxID=685502 RepID=A0A8H6RKS5_9PEZI|nr:putative acyltransferase [Pseudocercospora fuligena]